MPADISSAFFERLQQDGINIAELIDMTLPGGQEYHWTSANVPLTWTRSGVPTVYVPFPGNVGNGLQEDITLGVTVTDFTIANSGSDLQGQLLSADFALATMQMGRVFTDTPDLGRMSMYSGKMGDFAYDRGEITGEARNVWKSLSVQWPYLTYKDTCTWRFGSAGCGFNTTSVTITTTADVSSSTQTDLLLAGLDVYTPGFFDFGRVTIISGTNSGAVRAVRSHSGDLIGLSYPLSNPDLTGLTVKIFPGCRKRLLEDCHSHYNNAKNFLGFPWMPKEEQAW